VTLYNHFPIDRFIEHREEVLEMASFLSQAAQAIATIREKQALLQREQQRAQELAALNEVALIITAALDTKELLGKIVESAAKVVGADYVSVVLVGKDGTLDTSVDDFQGVPPLHLRARNQGKTREVIKTGKPIIVDSVSADDPSKHNPAIVRAGVESYAGIPIMSRGQVLGVLFVHSHRVGAFQGRISLLTTFVNQAAVALENARLFEEIQRWLRELKSLFEVGKNISTILDPDQLLRIIVEAAVQAIPAADKSSVHLLDEGEKRLSIRASVGYSPEVAKVVQLRVGDGLAGLVMQTGQSLIIQDFQTDSRVAWHDAHPEIAEIRSSVCVPLATQKRTIGALSVDNVHQVGAFSAEDARLLSALANQAAIAIENAQLYKRQAEDMATLAQLYQISTTLRTSLNPDHVLKIITANLQRMFDLATCTIGLLDEAEEQLDFVAHRGLEGPTTRSVRDLPQDLWRKVRVEKRRIFLEDLSKYPELAKQLERQDLKSFAVLPLQARERFLGILTMGSTERLVLDRFNWDLILALTDQAAVAIENAQLYQEVHQARKALDDSLKILTHQLRAEPAFVTNMVATLLAGKLGDLNKKQRDRLQKARRRLDEHHRLIDNINMYGRLKGGKIVPRRETIELAQLVRGAVASRRSEARRRGLVLRARLRKLPSIEADEGMIEIVLGNLLDNAVKFTPRGGHVCVEAWSDTEGVHIVIDDTGPGIRIEEREKVFDEYHQLESTPIRAEKGAGLGLYIAKKFVRMHEGRIAIVDKEGPGTRVEVVIPR
jgi:GAF domain-containing protein